MIDLSANLDALLFSAGERDLVQADLVEIHFPTGIQRITNHPGSITLDDARVFATSIAGGYEQHLGVGENGDVEFAVGVTSQTVGGLGWMQAARAGLFNGVRVVVLRAYSQTGAFGGYSAADLAPMFDGSIASALPRRDGSLLLTARDPIVLANVPVSRRRVQAQCPYTLGDSQCGVTIANFQHARTAASGSTAAAVKLSATSTFAATGALLKVTSGDLTGQARIVRSVSGVDMTLDVPLPAAPAVGVGLTVTAVCDKRADTCDTVFDNLSNFGGFPYAPTQR